MGRTAQDLDGQGGPCRPPTRSVEDRVGLVLDHHIGLDEEIHPDARNALPPDEVSRSTPPLSSPRDLPQKSLVTTLRRLERNGMVAREVVSTRPVAGRYRITGLGDTLQPLVEALFLWSSQNLAAVVTSRETVDDGLERDDLEREDQASGASPRFSRSVGPA